MGTTRPTEKGGEIAVTNSTALALLHVEGLPPGTKIFNEDVGHFFTLSTCAQTAITIDATDGYTAAQWTFANATFTDHEGDTLLIALNGTINESFGGAYTIDTVDSATEVTVTPAPSGSTTAPLAGSVVLIENALTTDVTVAVFGTIGSVWRLDTSDAEVASVTATAPITVNNADPQNPVVGIDTSAIQKTIADVYVYSKTVSDAAQSMIGTYFTQLFADDGHLNITQAPETDGSDYQFHPGLVVQRTFDTTDKLPGLVAQWVVKKLQGGGSDLQGGSRQEWLTLNSGGSPNVYALEDMVHYQPALGSDWYDPTFATPQDVTSWQRNLANRFGSTSVVQFNSDGVEWRDLCYPDGTARILLNSMSMNGTGGGPVAGSGVRQQLTGPSAGPAGGVEVASIEFVLTNPNFGSNQAAGAVNIRSSTLTEGPQIVASFSPTSRATVDVISAEIDFETATTVAVVPVQAGRRFLPQMAFVEFTSVAVLTVGPTLELGNNGGHDNVAPALAVANTVVTDSLVPFVMAVAPVVIDLTTTAILVDVNVQATATTALGRIHVIGTYIETA